MNTISGDKSLILANILINIIDIIIMENKEILHKTTDDKLLTALNRLDFTDESANS